MNRKRKKWVILAIGWGNILLGIAGLILPILPGIPFLVIGLVVLSGEYIWARNILSKLTARFPSVGAHLNHATEKAHAWINRPHPDSEN